MKKTFSRKSAFELEREMFDHFNGSIDEIASNYNRTKEEYKKELFGKRKQLFGYYAVRSPYHDEEYYLPFLVICYNGSRKAFFVLTIEYKGMTAYQVDSHYSEETILEFIANGTIVKRADMDDRTKADEIEALVQQYRNATIREE